MKSSILLKLVLSAAAPFAAISATAQPAEPVGIYVVRGPAPQLEAFQAEMRQWRGGEFLPHLSSKTEHRYWAYPTRTAPEARKFIFGSMEHRLRLDIEEYDESTYFPKERVLLDTFVSKCQARNPFRIQPNRTLLIEAKPGTDYEEVDCVLNEFRKANFESVMPVFLVGNEAQGERD